MKEYDPEVPSGYWEACDKYPDWEDDSIEDIWDRFQHWDQFKKGFPLAKAKGAPDSLLRKLMADSPAQLQEFQKRILAAHENRDFVFLEKLNKAIRLTNRPAPAMNAYRGAIEAFAQLFLDNESTTRDEWPTKQMVRERAKKILSEAGHAPISDRHWPRVFRQAGLAELPQGGYNRP